MPPSLWKWMLMSLRTLWTNLPDTLTLRPVRSGQVFLFTHFHGFICKCVRIYNEFGMIYIENTLNEQEILIPVSVIDSNPEGEHHCMLYNTINLSCPLEQIIPAVQLGDFNDDFNIDFLIDTIPILSDGGQYYRIPLVMSQLITEGTHEYVLFNGTTILSRGIAMVGEFKNQDSQYHKDIEYEQYTGE